MVSSAASAVAPCWPAARYGVIWVKTPDVMGGSWVSTCLLFTNNPATRTFTRKRLKGRVSSPHFLELKASKVDFE